MIAEAARASFVEKLLSMMNQIGNLGVFTGMTRDRSASDGRRIAWNCAIAVAVTLLVVAWAGGSILSFMGISVDSLRSAGGLIVLLIGLHMLTNNSAHQRSRSELTDASRRASIAVVPHAIPIVAGPGTMVTVILAGSQDISPKGKLEISSVIVDMAALTGLASLPLDPGAFLSVRAA